jgi:hypothetical protein
LDNDKGTDHLSKFDLGDKGTGHLSSFRVTIFPG